MAPTILVIGATGNTGQSVLRHLPKLLESSGSTYRIIGLTRSLNNSAAQKLLKLPSIEMLEKDWTTIDSAWLQSQEVVRVYIAPHNLPQQFVEESALHLALLGANVKYVVRVSTNTRYISPTSAVYYGRSHWAIENLLSQPEFQALQWTSLQPNFFTASYLASAAEWIKAFQNTGKQETLTTTVAADVAVGMIDPEDVGNIGAHLLALKDTAPHHKARYVLNGPEDITGRGIVELVERYVGVKVDNVEYKSTAWLNELISSDTYPAAVLTSILAGFDPLWQGECSITRTVTSREILELAPPRRTAEQALKVLVEA